MPLVDLTVDRNLVCPNFSGYKLSFDAVPVISQDFACRPLRLQLHANQYSLQHVELFAHHNLLNSDPWARHNSYFVNTSHQIVLCSYDAVRGQPREQRIVFNLEREDHGDGFSHLVGDYNYTIRFISEKYCVLCDGMLSLHLLDTGDRNRATPTEWQLVTSTPINHLEQQRGFVLYDARLDIIQERKQISTACGHVQRMEIGSGHTLQLVWARWTLEASPEADWKYNVCQRIQTKGSLYYCAFEPRAESLVLCSNKDIQTLAEAEREMEEAAAQQILNNEARRAYTWTQTFEDAVVRIPLPSGSTGNDCRIHCTNEHALVECLGQSLLSGMLFARIDEDLTTWTVEDGILLLTLTKRQEQLWPQLLQHGVQVPPQAPPDADLETDQLPIPNLEYPVEECDFPLGDNSADVKMVRFNLSAGCITHTILMGSTPPLFDTSLRAGYPAAFVTREGSDASLWLQQYQPSKPDEWSVRHEGNLHAFGYVLASKQKRKLVDCCPDLDYVVVAEDIRYVYVYKPRHDTSLGLRNRNGPQVVIGKHHLVTLDVNAGEVLGLSTAPNVITILTQYALMYLQV